MSLTVLFFSILSVLAIASAIVTISSKHPVRSAMALVVHFFMLAGLYLTLQAQFVAVMQILVYAGAIMVLVVFVIMLLNLGNDEYIRKDFKTKQLTGVLLAMAFSFMLVTAFARHFSGLTKIPDVAASQATSQAIGLEMFTNYLVPFEAIGVLLLGAIIGAVVLAKRDIDKEMN